MSRKLRILVVDDHEVVRMGLRSLIERQPHMEIVGEAATAQDAVQKAQHLTPDVVVLDLRLPDTSGIEVCRKIKARVPGAKVIVLTSFPDDELLSDAIGAGADGYILKQVGSDDLLRGLEQVGEGQSLLDPALTKKVFAKIREARRHERATAFADLTEREMQILARVAEGQTNQEIASGLSLSEKTVRNHVSNILSKLYLTSRTQAAAYATHHRIKDYL
jgi:DNA-binding NarL/FixJ family response regulator